MRHDFTTHPCRWPGCGQRVELWRWGCARHWFRLPRDIRETVTATWARGKGMGTTAHVTALAAAQAWIKANAFDVPHSAA